jgi:sugar (pentulose or hexulose) kinase
VNTHVFVDADLAVLHPAIVWQDGRAAAAGAVIESGIALEDKIAWLGAPIPVDASHALARMGWIERAYPDLWARTAHVLLPRDWIVARLTGALACDPMSSVGLVTPGLDYAAGLTDLLPGAAARLVPLADPLTVVGRVGADWPFSGTPVVLGMMDAWASLFGLGVAQDGEGMYLSGTSEVMGVVSASVTGEPGVITFPDWRGVRFHAGPTQSGGASLDWVARLVGRDVEGALSLAQPVAEGAPLFLPHLAGERAPVWDASRDGGSRRHDRAGQMSPRTWPLPSLEIAVGGGDAAFASCHLVGVQPGAHRAACLPPLEPGVAEDAVEPLALGGGAHGAGAGHHQRPHSFRHTAAGHHPGRGPQIVEAAVGARSDEDLLHRQARQPVAGLQPDIGEGPLCRFPRDRIRDASGIGDRVLY